MAANPHTYLTQFWGLYKVIRSPIEKVNFVVMKNTMYTAKKIHERYANRRCKTLIDPLYRYDLKGSTVGRTTDEENVRRSRIVLKDLNFNRQIKLNADRRKVFVTSCGAIQCELIAYVRFSWSNWRKTPIFWRNSRLSTILLSWAFII